MPMWTACHGPEPTRMRKRTITKMSLAARCRTEVNMEATEVIARSFIYKLMRSGNQRIPEHF